MRAMSSSVIAGSAALQCRSSPTKLGRCRRHTATEGSWVSAKKHDPSVRFADTSPRDAWGGSATEWRAHSNSIQELGDHQVVVLHGPGAGRDGLVVEHRQHGARAGLEAELAGRDAGHAVVDAGRHLAVEAELVATDAEIAARPAHGDGRRRRLGPP